MATSYNRYTGSAATGLYKDIVDTLFYINQNETMLFDTAKNVVAKDGLYHYWEEVVHAAKTSNPYKKPDGGSLTTGYTAPTKTERSNTIEESAVPFKVSKRTAEAAKKGGIAGVKNAWKVAKAEAMIELKDGVEWAMLNGTAVTGDEETASQMNGLIPLASSIGVTAGTSALLISGAEADFQTLLDAIRAKGGMRGRKKVLLTSYTNRKAIAKWTGRATAVNQLTDKSEIRADVDVYVSQYGPIMVEGHDMCASSKLVIYDAEQLCKAWLYNTTTIDLGIQGLVVGDAAVANALTLQYNTPSTLGHLLLSA